MLLKLVLQQDVHFVEFRIWLGPHCWLHQVQSGDSSVWKLNEPLETSISISHRQITLKQLALRQFHIIQQIKQKKLAPNLTISFIDRSQSSDWLLASSISFIIHWHSDKWLLTVLTGSISFNRPHIRNRLHTSPFFLSTNLNQATGQHSRRFKYFENWRTRKLLLLTLVQWMQLNLPSLHAFISPCHALLFRSHNLYSFDIPHPECH
jgi:hypothetical protein